MGDIRLGIVGSGFIASNLVSSLVRQEGMIASRILTRRPLDQVGGFPEQIVTNSIDDLVSHSDVVVECSGDPIWATDVVDSALSAGRPVVTMNTEFHITTGSSFVGKGVVTEAEGDQPGCLAALHRDAVAMGFEPVVYGNMKGFLNPDPTPEEMEFWGGKQGISLSMVTSFTDGTKVQAEQILVANHYGAALGQEGMIGAAVSGLDEAARVLTDAYENVGRPIADFVVDSGLPHGVFIIGTHDEAQGPALEYYKMGQGPYYTLIKNNIFVHLEIPKTVREVMEAGTVLLDNSSAPNSSLAAVTKRAVKKGTHLKSAIGSFDIRGYAVAIHDHPDHVPIGLLQDVEVVEDLDPGVILTSEHVSLPDSLAVRLWSEGLKD